MLLANLLGDARVLAKIKNFSASAAKRGEGHMSSQVAWRRRGKDPLFAARRRATTSTTGGAAGRGRRQLYWLGTLAAIRLAISTAEFFGSALHVLMSMTTLFREVSARPQPQPPTLAFS